MILLKVLYCRVLCGLQNTFCISYLSVVFPNLAESVFHRGASAHKDRVKVPHPLIGGYGSHTWFSAPNPSAISTVHECVSVKGNPLHQDLNLLIYFICYNHSLHLCNALIFPKLFPISHTCLFDPYNNLRRGQRPFYRWEI